MAAQIQARSSNDYVRCIELDFRDPGVIDEVIEEGGVESAAEDNVSWSRNWCNNAQEKATARQLQSVRSKSDKKK